MTLTLTHKLVLLTVLKLAALTAIYVFVFTPVSHAPTDAAAHIAGPAARP
ncbi:MAG: hypothetical protein WDM85_06330 [Caulobacteraceae bacterium]